MEVAPPDHGIWRIVAPPRDVSQRDMVEESSAGRVMECNGPGLKQAGKKAVHQAEAIEHRRGIRRELDSRSRIFDPVVALKERDRPAALRQ
jgi:hypothetical protein